jgi:hypothetical protein
MRNVAASYSATFALSTESAAWLRAKGSAAIAMAGAGASCSANLATWIRTAVRATRASAEFAVAVHKANRASTLRTAATAALLTYAVTRPEGKAKSYRMQPI